MTRGTVLAIAAGVVLLVVATVLGRAPERPKGPAGSSYATSAGGLAAYADLLQRAGHDVRRVRAPLDERRPRVGETVVVVDGRPLPQDERRALREHVRAGGRAILGGSAARALGGAAASGERRLGRGTLVVLPGAVALRNATLGVGDHAAEALMLAGPPQRRVAFVESVHGYRERTGLAALPRSVRTCLILLGVAALAFLILRGCRLGPPEPPGRDLPPPRRVHVEALAAALARTKDKDTILKPPPTPTTEHEPT
ncbi:DUF4350 domain-containing protein [Baekduia sp. Peel2402]|uniref:DUF4350 domain-containing protein n=1 Tax=Baekduia sp. Peel2402 TaxID=3458296 RepID=UPI00403EBA4A